MHVAHFCLVLKAEEEAGRTNLAVMGVCILPVEMRVEVTIVPRSPLRNLHDLVTGSGESFKLPVLDCKSSALTQADADGRSVRLVLDRDEASPKPP